MCRHLLSGIKCLTAENRRLTIPSSGQSTGCARRLPLMSNVRRHQERTLESPMNRPHSADREHMIQAIEAMQRSTGRGPKVGAVLVKDGRVLASGFRQVNLHPESVTNHPSDRFQVAV